MPLRTTIDSSDGACAAAPKIEVHGLRGEALGQIGSGAGIGFPHRKVQQHMRVEPGDNVDDALAIAGLDQMELAATKSPPRRVDIDAQDRADPRLALEQRRHQ